MALTLAMTAAFFTTGCASMDAESKEIARDTAFELVTKVAVSEALKSDTERAETVVTVASLIIDGITSEELAVPAAVDAAIKDLVMSSDLTPSSKQAIMVLADSLKARYLSRIEAGQLAPNVTAPIKTIVGWVKSSAEDTIRYGVPQRYGVPPLEPTRRRQDLVGHIMGWEEPTPGYIPPGAIDRKWKDGIEHMLKNPSDLDPDIAAHLDKE